MKAWKIAACIAGGALAAIGGIIAYDQLSGKKRLTRPYGIVVDKEVRDDGYFILVRRCSKLYEVEVDEVTYSEVKLKTLYDLTAVIAELKEQEAADRWIEEALAEAECAMNECDCGCDCCAPNDIN